MEGRTEWRMDVTEEGNVDPRLLELLACPLTKGPLAWDPERGELISRIARLAYPVAGRHSDHAALGGTDHLCRRCPATATPGWTVLIGTSSASR